MEDTPPPNVGKFKLGKGEFPKSEHFQEKSSLFMQEVVAL